MRYYATSRNIAHSCLAEKEGFEPSMSYQPIHEFQSCAINRARRLLHSLLFVQSYNYSLIIIPQTKVLVNTKQALFVVSDSILFPDHAILIIEPIIRASIVWFVEEPIILVLVEVDQADILLVVLVIRVVRAGITAALDALFLAFAVHRRPFGQ